MRSHIPREKPNHKIRGLDSLLNRRSGQGMTKRGSNNQSFNINMGSALATENNNYEMSIVLGSNTSVVDGGDEDIVIDSGGRQINHLNNFVESQPPSQ